MGNAQAGVIQVLHVDDEPGFSEMVADFLEHESDRLNVETTTSPAEALERLQTNRVDCVVSDYDMPGKNGIEFLEAVRDDFPDLPFILYTGKGSEEVASGAISTGVTDYLQKQRGTSQYEVLANRIVNTVEKYRAQKKLEVSQRRLNLFFEQSPLGVIRWDENFDLERMNDEATEILGYDDHELRGRSWEAIVPESDRDAVDEVVSNLLEDEGGYHSVNENARKDGERIVCEWHNRVVNDDGEVVAIYSQFQDITERRERERRFKAIFNNAYTFTGLMDPDGTLLEANETALTFGDVEREEIVGQPVWDTYWFEVYDDAQAAAKEAVEHARDGELFRDEIRVRGADDDAVIDFSVRPIFDENGEVTLLVPEGREITDRKEREQELRETKADLESTVSEKERQNQAFDAFLNIVTDTSLSFDEQMTALLDLGVEFLDLDIGIISNIDPPGYTVEHVVTPDGSIEQGEVLDFTDTFCTLVYQADGPVAFRNPKRGEVKDHPCYQDLGLQAYLGEPLKVEGTRYGTLNFSSPNPREEPFSDGERAFIRTIAEWVTKEMSRSERKEEIWRQNERFDEFASMVSHDLQPPLVTARGWAELAVETGDTEQMQKALDALDRADELRNDLVEVLRTKAIGGKTEPVDIEQIGRDTWETVTTHTSASLQVRDAHRVETDPDAFRRLLENLFSNAIEHGTMDVTVRIGMTDEGFFIEDDGPGIPEDEREDVFTRGYTTKPDGSGVGLASVREIIVAHDWDIRIVTGSEGGARFEVTGVGFVEG